MSLADFFTFDQPPREHQYVFRANEQPDLGRHGLRLLLIGASVPSRQMRLLRELRGRADRACGRRGVRAGDAWRGGVYCG